MKAEIIPMMIKLNEEYFLQYKDFTISKGGTYRIPTRAIGSVVRNLQVLNTSGQVISSSLQRLYEEDRALNKSGYYMLRNSIELSADYTTGTLRMKYFARPSDLVLPTACAQITAIDTVNKNVTVSSVPTTFANGLLADLVQNNNPYDLLSMDQAILGISGTTISFSALPSDLANGDWVTLAGQAPVPMVPEEMQPVLIQSALCKTLSSKKDKAYKDELDTLMRVKEDAINMLDPRVEDNTNKVRSGKLLGYFSARRY